VNARGGYTILEIVIVLAVVTVLAAASTPVVVSMIRAEQLRAPARELEAMAITARTSAISEQRPYRIVLNPRGFHLEQPVVGASKEPVARFELARDVEFEMAAWPDMKWKVPRDRIWYFPPTGLCEPIHVIFRKDDAFFSQQYSAITGWEHDSTSFFP